MTCPSIVRIAKPADHAEIWRLFLNGHRENGLFPYDAQKVDWWFRRLLDSDSIPPWDTGPRGAIGVIGSVGNLEAAAILAFGQYWYSSQRHLEEFVVYVDAECRHSDHAKALVNWMKEQTEITGLPLVTGILSKDRTEAKVRLYERMLPKVGAFFLWSPINGKGSVVGSSTAYA